MIEPLDLIWAAFDSLNPVFTADVIQTLPNGWQSQLLQAGILIQSDTASHVVCPSCNARHVEEVTRSEVNGCLRFFIQCPESLRVEVPQELLWQWQPNFPALAKQLRELLSIDGRVRERVDNRVWRIGAMPWKSRSREIFLMRGLVWDDGPQLVEHIGLTGSPILLIGAVWPRQGFAAATPALVPLPAVLHLTGGKLQLDGKRLIQLVDDADQIARLRGSISDAELRKRIEALMEQRVAEGPKNEVITALRSQGLSLSEISSDMEARGMPIHRSNVARRLKKTGDPARTESSSSVIRSAASQPRNRKRHAIVNAQPKHPE